MRLMLGGALGLPFLAALTMAASAQNAALRDNPTSLGVETLAQNGPPVGTTRASKAMSEADIRAYIRERSACDRQSVAKQEQCRAGLASRWGNVDPKCQKLSGASLDACLRGADRGQ
jgi:hypothetical protein